LHHCGGAVRADVGVYPAAAGAGGVGEPRGRYADLPAGRQGGEPITRSFVENKSLLVNFSITILLLKYFSCASSCFRL